MPNSGKTFGVDLYRLEQVAKDYLPDAAEAYRSASAGCRDAGSMLDGIQPVPQQFVGAEGPALDAIGEMQRLIASIVDETGTILDEAAQSLVQAVRMYADSDQAAATEMHRLMEERSEPGNGAAR